MKVLYISYDGMTDSLGQSQVIPYLLGLVKKGHKIHILSCEKPDRYGENRARIKKLLDEYGLVWHPCKYTKKPPVFSTLIDIYNLRRVAMNLQRQVGFDLIHCRSYISPLIALVLKKKFNVPFVFDMRGFWADERVDGGLWKLGNPIYRWVYSFFKKREKEFLLKASQTVCLTHLARDEILKLNLSDDLKINIIPCCVDLSRFSVEQISSVQQDLLKRKLGLTDADFIVTYLGSVGTWYMVDEMFAFFERLLLRYPHAKFLFITPDDPVAIKNIAKKNRIQDSQLIITHASHEEVPPLLSLAKLGLFFIKPTYSKMASSPTKFGEFLSMGIPVITNVNVGDNNWIVSNYGVGALVSGFDSSSYDTAIHEVPLLLQVPGKKIRQAAQDYFSLNQGIESYQRIYLEALSGFS